MRPCASCGADGTPAHELYCPLAVTCPTCRRGDRQWCERPSGHKAMTLHKDRITLAERGAPWTQPGLPGQDRYWLKDRDGT